MDDPHDLRRFELAQDRDGVYARAVAELRAGRKRSHWMWFVFPQLAGLGHSAMSRTYSIRSLEEARAYLAHPVLGPRLRACARILIELDGATGEPPRPNAQEIFGPIDAQKLRSSMTVFARAAPSEPAFRAVLDRYFDGILDALTDHLLAGRQPGS